MLDRQAVEARLQRAVDDEVAAAHDGAADQRLVHVAVQPHFALQALLQCRGQALPLRIVERHRRSDLHVGNVLRFRAQVSRTSPRSPAAARAGGCCASMARKLRPSSSIESPQISAMNAGELVRKSRADSAAAVRRARPATTAAAAASTSDQRANALCCAGMLERGLGVGAGDGGFLGHDCSDYLNRARSPAPACRAARRAPWHRSRDRAAGSRRTPPASRLPCAAASRARAVSSSTSWRASPTRRWPSAIAAPRASSTSSVERRFACSTILPARACASLDDVVRRVLRFGEALLAALGGGEAFGDLLLPLLDRRHDVRPAELHDQPGHREEREALDDDSYCEMLMLAPIRCASPARRRRDSRRVTSAGISRRAGR